MNAFLTTLTRRRYHDYIPHVGRRHLGVLELTVICIGCIVGSGIYMVSGLMIKQQAGPSTIISFIIAGILNILYGFVYAEVGTRMPNSGSFYAFGYAIYGEMLAFIMGIFFSASHLLGGVTSAQAMAFYIDSLSNGVISDYFSSLYVVKSYYLLSYFSPLPFLIVLVMSSLFLFKLEDSKKIAITLVFLNAVVLFTVIIGGSTMADTHNWKISLNSSEATPLRGSGGFAPFGISGIFTATIGAFYSLGGVDIIAIIAGEVINPLKTIPISTCLSVTTATISYIATTCVISMMSPYYNVDIEAPFASVFKSRGRKSLCYAISVGCICGIASSIFGEILSGSRLIHSLMEDNLFPKIMYSPEKDVMTRRSCIIFGLLMAIISIFPSTKMIVDLTELSLLISIVFLNIMVINIRYSDQHFLIGNYNDSRLLTYRMRIYARILTAILTILSLAIAYLVRNELSNYKLYLALLLLLISVCIVCTVVLSRFPMITDSKVFMTPLVPFLPVFSNFVTFIIFFHISRESWIIYSILIGFCILAYLINTWVKLIKNGILFKNEEKVKIINHNKVYHYNSFG